MLNLYVLKSCPFCGKVVEFIKNKNIDIEIKDIEQSDNFQELMRLGGKEQVPFLHDTQHDVTMYDSAKIMEYLDKNY